MRLCSLVLRIISWNTWSLPTSVTQRLALVTAVYIREGDKVMQIKNNYQLEWEISTKYGMTIDKGMGIFNGDMGIITPA